MFSHPDYDGHEALLFAQDTASGLRALIAIHDTTLGPAFGGCRMYPYASEQHAMTDVAASLARHDLQGGDLRTALWRRRSTPCLSPIAPRTSSLAVQTQRRRLRRSRPERSAWPEPEPTSSGPWQPREPMLPDDRLRASYGPSHPTAAHLRGCLFCGLKQTAAARRAGYSNRGHAANGSA